MASARLDTVPTSICAQSLPCSTPPHPVVWTPLVVSLDALVPVLNVYRHLEAVHDLSCVRDWMRERYATRGQPSIDSVGFFALQFVMVFGGARSEQKLMEAAGGVTIESVSTTDPDSIEPSATPK